MSAQPELPLPAFIKTVRVYGDGLFALYERQKRGEVRIYAIEIGDDNAQWLVEYSEENDPAAKNIQAR